MNPINTTTTSQAIPIAIGQRSSVSSNVKKFRSTESQMEIWLSSQQCREANCAYNEISSLTFHGNLDIARLQRAITKVAQRHSMLRARFSEDGLNIVIDPEFRCQLEMFDLSNLDEPAKIEKMRTIVADEGQAPFDLVKGPLIRFVMQRLSAATFKLTFTAHHLVMDGWSLAVFCRDLGFFYDEEDAVSTELQTADDYEEYASLTDEYLSSTAGRDDEDYWLQQFADSIPTLDLPIDNSRPALRTYNGGRVEHVLPAQLIERARKLGAKQACSLFNVMLASFGSFLSRISGQNDICIGIPTAGQAAMDRAELIGHCVNTLPFRTEIENTQPFDSYLKTTRGQLLDALEHQRYSYGTLLRKIAPPRDPSRPPLLAVSFNIDPEIDTKELGFSELDVEIQIEPRSFEHFEWFVNGVIKSDQSIELQVQYNADLYSPESMQFFLECYEAYLESIVANPSGPIKDHHLMSIPQRRKLIVDWNETTAAYPQEATLPSEFSRQAATTPNAPAVKFQGNVLTYNEVESRSNQIARFLQLQGVKKGDLIGICVDRSEEMLVYLYGIMKSGAGYVPLDPAYPSDRLRYMCEHSGLKLVVTQKSLVDSIRAFEKPLLALDSHTDKIAELSRDAIEDHSEPNDICYVIYTSGSTGKPKGVQVPHGAVVNFLYGMAETPRFAANDSVLAVTTLSFDIAVLELYLPTIFGGQTVILDSLTAADGMKLAEQLNQNNISVMQATPATWRLMIQAGWQGKQDLKILCGGEPMPSDLVGPLLDRCGELWNMYGPTETTVWSAAYQIRSSSDPIMIGKPIANTQIYILDQNGNEVPIGCEGEIYIGGAGVTRGYLNRTDLTSERFVKNRYRNPFANYVSDRLYRTGDLARYRHDGNIQFLRRNDKQVKVRGFRIELGEIESTLDQHPDLTQNVVVVREDTPGDTRLVAYSVINEQSRPTSSELRDFLRATLPHYMVPQHFVLLDSFPQTNNGKIDYKALPAPAAEMDRNANSSGPQSAAEKFLAAIWLDATEADEVENNDTFFDIGGHSLLVMQVIAKVADETGIRLSPQDFLMSTLGQLAAKLENADRFKGTTRPTIKAELLQEMNSEVTPAPNIADADSPNAEDFADKGIFRKLKGFWD